MDSAADLDQLTTLGVEVGDGVATVTLQRPEVHNAFDPTMVEELASVCQALRADPEVRAIVLTGSGDKAFCTGIDRSTVPEFESSDLTYDPFTYEDPGKQLGPKSQGCWKPVIAAVNGMACGGAFYMIAEADIVIAAEHATFFDPHVTYAMPAVYEPLLMLHRGMPFGEILRMSLLGNHERLSAARALEIGLLSEVCPSGELEDRATWIAEAIASAPAAPMQATLRTLWAGRELSRKQALDLGNTFLNLSMSEATMAEGQEIFASGARIEPRVR